MILTHSLVPNTKQPYGISNGWKLFLPYSEKMMEMIKDEKVLTQGVDISFLKLPHVKGNGHLLWNVANDKETNSLIKKNGYEHDGMNIKIKERRPSLNTFGNILIDSGCTLKRAETLKKVVRMPHQILFIKLWGPHQPIHRFIDGKDIVDKSYQIDTKNKTSSKSYILPTNKNIISLNDIIKLRSFQKKYLCLIHYYPGVVMCWINYYYPI